MNAKLIKTFLSEKLGEELEIQVDYNPETDSVDDICHIRVRDLRTSIGHDLTSLYCTHLSGHLDTIVSEVNWRGIYREQKPAITPSFNMLDYVQKLAATTFPNLKKVGS